MSGDHRVEAAAATTTAPGPAWSRAGLSQAEAERRLAAGPPSEPGGSRSYGSIVRANVFTVFNLILLVFGVLTLAFGDARDALFLAILVANASIGIAQEVRAKHALDRLSALVAPRATVVRDGGPRSVAVEEVVTGDLVRAGAGDQVVGDGRLVGAEGLSLDESILTGESQAVPRAAGDEVRSGSFVAEGAAEYVVEAVGQASYAERLAGEARQFRHPRSPLERSLNRLLLALSALIVPLGAILGYALAARDTSFRNSVSTATAGVVTLVPEGLILLASLTFAASALRVARRGALAQQLSAIESLASVDAICSDKTGTLTESGLRVAGVVPAPDVQETRLAAALGRYAASAPAPNATLRAIGDAYEGEPGRVEASVPFSSRRRWSAVRLDGTTLVLGAPEVVGAGPLAGRADEEARAGRRVLALAETPAGLPGDAAGDAPPPGGRRLLGLVLLAERLRPDARATVEYLRGEGVDLYVLSGDAPETVAAIAADAGIEPDGPPLVGTELPDDPAALRDALGRSAVVGRISPAGKRHVVRALRAGGRRVAMVGDGVNDVPALKAAELAIAQGSGAQMARSVADIVLVRGDFAVVPPMIREGRQVLRNVQRVAKLFVVKSMLAAFLILTVGLVPTSYPFLPRHLTLASLLTIGIPAFFLALAPSSGPWAIRRFLREVSRFAVPAGVAAGLAVVSSYLFALNVLHRPVTEAQTVAVTALVAVGLYLIVALEASGFRRSAWVAILCVVLAVAYGLTLAAPGLRSFFQLAVPSAAAMTAAFVGAALAVGGLVLTDDRFVPGR
jgi:magnesium-transporting ATPase (P-type)